MFNGLGGHTDTRGVPRFFGGGGGGAEIRQTREWCYQYMTHLRLYGRGN